MPVQDLLVRPLTEAELPRLAEIDTTAFLETPNMRALIEWQQRFLETERTIGLFDGELQVGGASLFTMRLTVPEAKQVPMAGVTWVGVLPTHRRRGGLKKMMRHQLDTLHETGAEPVAGLTASQAEIYGRFGYALATDHVVLTVPRHANALRLPAGTDEVTLRLVDLKSALPIFKEKYDRQILFRPGTLEMTGWRQQLLADDPAEMRQGGSKLYSVLAERDGVSVGCALYRTRATAPQRQVDVQDVYADDPAAYAALWQMLLNIDLSMETFAMVAVDDPLLFMLEDRRSAKPSLADNLYVRLVDVDRALEARTYAEPIDAVFEVVDEICPWNAGRWRLSGDVKGATCVRTDSPADLTVGIRELASIYLGGVTLRSLEHAGQVAEHTNGAVRSISKAFASDIQPRLPYGF